MNSISNSYDLFIFLKDLNLIESQPLNWWPANSELEILLGSILTQNTKWENDQKSLKNLEKSNLLSLEKLSCVDLEILTILITPSGFKNQKAKRIKLLAKNIIEEFGDFENFCLNVSRNWILEQKGIGPETADAIMCYCIHSDEMVVDSYTNRLLKKFGYEFESYDDLKSWLEYGINENFDKIKKIYTNEISLNTIYCRFHGKIVEYMKNNK